MAVVDPAAEDDAMGDEEDAAGEDDEPDAAVEDALELHAAAPMLRLTARPDRARRRYFMMFSLWLSVFLNTGCGHPADAAAVT
jgi:hypothetical protein